jgi:hypothetical protein
VTQSSQFQAQAGTYLQVTTVPGFPFPNFDDSYRVLYLRPSGTFLFLGYWPGFERSNAAGRWSTAEGIVELDGFGQIDGDALPNPDPGRFQRTFTYSLRNFSPILTAEKELPGWSLLGWAGEYWYIGENIFDPDRRWLPQSIRNVDDLIDRSLRRLDGPG